MDLREYTRVLRKRWLTIAVTTLLFMGAALFLTASTTKVYTATASSYVDVNTPLDASNQNAIYQQSQFTIQRVKSFSEFVKSPSVIDPVITLTEVPFTTKQLRKKVSASSPTDTSIMNVTVTDPIPARAAMLANAIARSLADYIEKTTTPDGTTKSPIKMELYKPADVPTVPSAPRPTFNLVLGILLGLAVGITIAVVREQLNSSIETAADLTAITGANPLGSIQHNKSKMPLVALQTHTTASEAFRTIRTNLRFTNVDQAPRTMVITSAAPQDGKTTVACNLAIALAEGGARVCLVDADLRRPRVGEVLGTDNTAGLTDVLAGQHRLADVLVEWNQGLLTVLTSGSVPPDPNALLSSQAMVNVIKQLSAEFDMVIIDTPPLLPVTDALVVAEHCDGVLLVTRRGRTQRQHAKAAIESLDRAGAKLLGAIFNDVKLGRGPTGRRYGYVAEYLPKAAPAPEELPTTEIVSPLAGPPAIESIDAPEDFAAAASGPSALSRRGRRGTATLEHKTATTRNSLRIAGHRRR